MPSDCAFLCAFRGQNNPEIPKKNIEIEYHCTPFSPVPYVVNCAKNEVNLTLGC